MANERAGRLIPYATLKTRLRLSQAALGRLFRVPDRTARRWDNGESRVPTSVRIALYLIHKHGEDPAALFRELQIKGVI